MRSEGFPDLVGERQVKPRRKTVRSTKVDEERKRPKRKSQKSTRIDE